MWASKVRLAGRVEGRRTYLRNGSPLLLGELTVEDGELRGLSETEGTVVGLTLRKTVESLVVKVVEVKELWRERAGIQTRDIPSGQSRSPQQEGRRT